MGMDQSNEEGPCHESLSNISACQHLGVELSTLFGILQNGRDLYRSTPVGIVKTLTVDQLLQISFFECACVVNNFVVVRDNTTFVRLLAHDEEIEIQADDFLVDEGTWGHISSIFVEKPLAVLEVNHHDGQSKASAAE